MTDTIDRLPRSLWSLLCALTLVWGFNWAVMKVVITEIPPWGFRSVCLASGFVGLLSVARWRGQPIVAPLAQWWRIALVALFTVSLQTICIMLALPLLSAGRVVIVLYTMPAWSVLLARVVLSEALTRRRLLGALLGLCGVLVLLVRDLPVWDQATHDTRSGLLLMLGAAMVWAMGVVLQKRFPVNVPMTTYTAWMAFFGGIPIVLLAWVFERDTLLRLHGFTLWPVMGVVYNMLFVFVFGWWAWTKIVDEAPAGVAGLASLMIPVVGVASGMLVLAETPTVYDWCALACVMAAIATVLMPSQWRRVASCRD